jgi:hypothetical protein
VTVGVVCVQHQDSWLCVLWFRANASDNHLRNQRCDLSRPGARKARLSNLKYLVPQVVVR